MISGAAPRGRVADLQALYQAGFLAGYHGLTLEAYPMDLRQFSGWCRAQSLPLFSVRRADIETFARELEAHGRTRATVTRRLCTIAGSCKYAVEKERLDHSPAALTLAAVGQGSGPGAVAIARSGHQQRSRTAVLLGCVLCDLT
jgi:site-specific recombinase XerD